MQEIEVTWASPPRLRAGAPGTVAALPQGRSSKVAVTVWLLPAVAGWQTPVPRQRPSDQPTNREPGEGVAVSVAAPAGTDAEQVAPQSIPPTLLETLPDP